MKEKDYSNEYNVTSEHDLALVNFDFKRISYNDIDDVYEYFKKRKEFKKYINEIIKNNDIIQIILFGSIIKGTSNDKSDIDLFILYNKNISNVRYEKNKINENYGFLCQKVDPYPYSYEYFHKLKFNKNIFIYPSMKNAVIIFER